MRAPDKIAADVLLGGGGLEGYRKRLRIYLAANGLKRSRQRDSVVDVFFAGQGHRSVDDILLEVKGIDARVSQATVYRTMRLLVDSGLAQSHDFGGGHSLYEVGGDHVEHHDHLICNQCGTIVEFIDEEIERLQEHVAQRYGFIVEDHRMELYGICLTCRNKS